jgi:FAD/FMN-containing dehydrogenase
MGTLGILCEMTIRMLPMPEKMETLLISFPTLSKASAFTGRIFETSLLPAAVDIMNKEAYSHLKRGEIPDLGSNGYVAAVALEAFGPAVKRMRDEILEMAKDGGGEKNAVLEEENHGTFWLEMGHLSATLQKKFSGFISGKLNYPLSLGQETMAFGESVFSKANLNYTLQAHAGNGICLAGLLIDQQDTAATKKAVVALEQLLERCCENNGNLIIQHAPTQVKGELKMWGESGSDFVVMKRLKDQVDPNGIMSPGRFVNGL